MSSICFNFGQAFFQLPNALMKEYIFKNASLQNHWTHILEPTSETTQFASSRDQRTSNNTIGCVISLLSIQVT